MTSIQKLAQKNIKLYPLQKVFNKRVFLPIIPIYFTEYVGFSIGELGLLASLYALVSIVMNAPSSYVADRFGKVKALRMGAVMLVLSTVLYAGLPTQLGVVFGTMLEAIGFSFMSGAGEAMVHDSLEVLNRLKDYSKVLSRAQSLALILNAILVALVPLTYVIDPRMPFALGTVAFMALVAATFNMHDVGPRAQPMDISLRFRRVGAIEKISKNASLLVAIMLFGIIGAIYFSFDIMSIALKYYGVQPEHLGWVYATASIVGAGLGYIIHHLKKLSLTNYLLVDVTILMLVYVAGYSANVWFLMGAVIASVSFWRFRRIIYQDHLLSRYTTQYKTTILSVMGTAESVNMLWVPIVTAGTVGAYGPQVGFGYLAIGVLGISLVYILAMQRAFLAKE